jgi:chemosensory pili system protein ChpA (sensor histidine kinase/response regulator)
VTNGSLPLATVDEAHASLLVIAREVATELNEARVALEAFADKPEDRGALHRFAAHIHLARGALRLAEVYGGALLAEEMEHVARYVDAHSGEGRADSDGLDALMRAMEQLPAYVERVATGARDLPIMLLPLLNDLRAVRGGPLLSEGTLLLLNLRSDEPARPSSPFAGDREVGELARKLRPRFQLALLGWIRGENAADNLHHLAEIAVQFEQAASTKPLFQLWWVVSAVLEALQAGGIDANVSIKRLLGHVDRELRRLQEQGENRYAESPPVEVLHNLLYYVAQSAESGPRVAAVRQSFQLHDVVAAHDGASPDVDSMSAPSVRLMRTVAAAIREDLTRVKDVLDIFVRKGATQVDDLVPQLDMLRKISDTLGVLGLGALRARVEGELDSLKAIVERRIPPDDTALLSIAAALIAVEDSLDSQLVRLILPEAGPVAGQPGEPTDEEFRLVQEAVLRECIVNMARIKEAVTQSLSAPAEAQGLDQVPQLVRGITAGLLMLGKQRAVEVMEGVGRALGTIVRPDENSLAPARLERLADAIVAVEYYMETLQAGRADQWQMLDAAEARLAEIEPSTARILPWREQRPAAEPGEAPALPAAAPPAAEHAEAPAPAPVPAAMPAAAKAAAFTAADPEFLQLFVEEARENVTRLEQLFPQWEQNPLDAEALRDLRRAFHTLKGSGRMVGAQRVGEFSWSIESLLNRVISQTLARSPDIVSVVRDAVAAMPQLIDEIDGGGPASIDIAGIMARADALSGREGPALPSAAAAPAAPVPEAAVPAAEAVAADEADMDPVLREIFRKETAGHILVVRQFLERCARGVAPHPVSEALYRACHTLSGIAKTAGARQGIKVAEPMEHYIRKLYDNGHGMSEESLALLQDTVRLLETVSEHVDESSGFFPEQGRLTAGWLALDRALDAELAKLAEAAERTLGDSWKPAVPAPIVPAEPTLTEAPAWLEEFTEPSLSSLADESLRAEPDIDHTAPHQALPEGQEAPPAPAAEVTAEPTATGIPAEGLEAQAPIEPSRPASVEPSAPVSAEVPFEVEMEEDFDADIAAIFGEEATELLEQAEAAFSRWRADRADRAQVTELKRLLHTLKGGARMAGIRAMGDLSHEVESFLAAIESDSARGSAAALDVLQASLDELHRMREMANSGQRIASARDLIARIRRIGTEEGVEAAPSPVAEPPVTPTVAEVVVEPAEVEEALPPVAAEAVPEVAAEAVPLEPELPAIPAEEWLPEFEAEAVGGAAEVPEELPASAAWQPIEAPAAEMPAPEVPTPAEAPVETPVVAEAEVLAEIPPEMPAAAPVAAPAAFEVPVEVPQEAPVEAAVAAPEFPVAAEPIIVELPPEVAAEVLPEFPVEIAAHAPPEAEQREWIEAPVAPGLAPPAHGEPLPQLEFAPPPVLPGREPVVQTERAELARVDAELLDDLLNNAGEVSIFRARIEQQMTSIEFNLAELDRTVTRLREQLRKLEMETEAQILHKHQQDDAAHRADFDPLELDRYSTIQQLSRALAESVSDVASIEGLLANLNRETQNLLQQQGRIVTEVQNGLMRTRMVPFQRHVQRLTRLLRQAANEAGKKVELVVEGASGELDRQVLERMLPPFEHMLRNAVVHGIEPPLERVAAGKPETGQITMRLQREGAEVVIIVEDDGAGLNVPAIRTKARQMGLLRPDQELTDEEALQLVLEPGFSTASRLTQSAGRGVGMDVVATEVKKLGGGLYIESRTGYGARFTIRLPFTLAITQALIVRVHDELYALPMATVEGVARLTRSDIERHLAEEHPSFEYGGNVFRFQHLGTFVGSGPSVLPETDTSLPVILVRAGEHSTALVTDELIGSREIVVKSVGPQIASIRGISGATILGDGRIVIILDMGTLVRSEWRARSAEGARSVRDDRIFALVVDDSITVRRVTQRLLERNGMRVMTAKDGVEAMALLQEHVPDVILLDIEMPRMDGYEVAAHVRNDARLADVPIIMITSRVGDKHRARAIELGVDDYLGKPYQESQLLDAIEPLVLARRRQQD